MRQAVIRKGEDGKWVAEIPSLPGCISEGDTLDEAVRNITEAAELWIETVRLAGRAVPQEDLSVLLTLVPAPAA